MTDPSAPAASAPPAAPRDLIERQLRVLGELAEIGLNLARAVERRAALAPTCEPSAEAPGAAQAMKGDVWLAYTRIARAVRLTLALQSRLIQDLQALDEAAERQRLGGCSNAARARKARVRRILARVIDAEIGDEAEAGRLAAEARERLEHDDIYGDVLTKPVGELIALICRDLGLSPDWSLLAEEAWAQAEIAGGEAQSPFVSPPGRRPDPPDHPAAAAQRMAPQAASP